MLAGSVCRRRPRGGLMSDLTINVVENPPADKDTSNYDKNAADEIDGEIRADDVKDMVDKVLDKVGEGRPNVVDHIINGRLDWIINTPLGAESKYDERAIRRTALEYGLPIITTLAAAQASVQAIIAMRQGTPQLKALHEYHADLK